MFMIPFDLTPDRCNGFHAHGQKSGVINLELHFREVIANPFNVMAFATYDTSFSMDKNGKITILDMMFAA